MLTFHLLLYSCSCWGLVLSSEFKSKTQSKDVGLLSVLSEVSSADSKEVPLLNVLLEPSESEPSYEIDCTPWRDGLHSCMASCRPAFMIFALILSVAALFFSATNFNAINVCGSTAQPIYSPKCAQEERDSIPFYTVLATGLAAPILILEPLVWFKILDLVHFRLWLQIAGFFGLIASAVNREDIVNAVVILTSAISILSIAASYFNAIK